MSGGIDKNVRLKFTNRYC